MVVEMPPDPMTLGYGRGKTVFYPANDESPATQVYLSFLTHPIEMHTPRTLSGRGANNPNLPPRSQKSREEFSGIRATR